MLTLHEFIFNQRSRKLKSQNNQFCCSCFFYNSARPIYCIQYSGYQPVYVFILFVLSAAAVC